MRLGLAGSDHVCAWDSSCLGSFLGMSQPALCPVAFGGHRWLLSVWSSDAYWPLWSRGGQPLSCGSIPGISWLDLLPRRAAEDTLHAVVLPYHVLTQALQGTPRAFHLPCLTLCAVNGSPHAPLALPHSTPALLTPQTDVTSGFSSRDLSSQSIDACSKCHMGNTDAPCVWTALLVFLGKFQLVFELPCGCNHGCSSSKEKLCMTA